MIQVCIISCINNSLIHRGVMEERPHKGEIIVLSEKYETTKRYEVRMIEHLMYEKVMAIHVSPLDNEQSVLTTLKS